MTKEEILAAIKAQFDEAAKGVIKTDELSDKLKELKDKLVSKEDLKEFSDAVEKHGLAIEKLKGGGGKTEEKTILQQIEAQKTGITKAVNKEIKELDFVVKANATRADVTNSTQALRLDGIGQLAHRRLVARDIFTKIPVGPGSNGVIRYADWDDATKVRATAMVAEGNSFPESTAKWEEFSLDLKKVGDTIPVTEEMVQDAPRFAAELRSFLDTNVAIVEDTQLISGDGTGNNLNGIYPTIPTYTPVPSGIQDASIYDLIVKVSEAITKPYGSKYMPDFAMMNITDINRMKLKKDENNNYIIPPFATTDGMNVDGILVLEVNALTENTMALGDARFAKLYEVEAFNISLGFTGDQFIQDLMTLKAKKRENLLIRNVDETGFLKVTDIDAALTTLAT